MTDIIKRIEDANKFIDQQWPKVSRLAHPESEPTKVSETIQAVLTAVLKMHRGELPNFFAGKKTHMTINRTFFQEIERQLDDK